METSRFTLMVVRRLLYVQCQYWPCVYQLHIIQVLTSSVVNHEFCLKVPHIKEQQFLLPWFKSMCLISLDIISCTALCPIPRQAMTSLTSTLRSALMNATASCLPRSKLAVLGKPLCGRSEMSVLSSLVFHPMSHTKPTNNFAADMFYFTRN